jgi:hypothetical protein
VVRAPRAGVPVPLAAAPLVTAAVDPLAAPPVVAAAAPAAADEPAVAPVVAPLAARLLVTPAAVDDPEPAARFADVCAGFDAGASAGVGSGDDGCIADVLTPGSRSAGGGATLDLAGTTALPWPEP